MKTLITLARFISLPIDSDKEGGAFISCEATVTGGEHPMSKEPITEQRTVSAPLGDDRSNDGILAAFAAHYPDDTVAWAEAPASRKAVEAAV